MGHSGLTVWGKKGFCHAGSTVPRLRVRCEKHVPIRAINNSFQSVRNK